MIESYKEVQNTYKFKNIELSIVKNKISKLKSEIDK